MLVITGASGHIGNNLVRLLMEREIPFKVLLRREGKELAGLDIEKYIGNLYSYDFYNEQINKGDTVIHLAGYIDLENKDYHQCYQANYEMTKIIADICLEKNVRLIFTSSTDILYHSDTGFYIEEDVEKIKDYYPKTKTMATLYVKELQKKGLNAIILYPTSVIGINDHKGSHAGKEIVKGYNKKWLPYVKGGYDFIDVLDVSNAIINAVSSPVTDDIILSGNYYTIKELYQLIGKLTGEKKKLIYVPRWLAKFGTRFIDGLSPMMIDIVAKSRPFNDPKTKLILTEQTPIETTFENVIKEANAKK
ncbi:MAG: NAD-dependent epimerase/dehydratase family protein [Acholeplasmataceae bacterium]|jgi:dihydroflavonol-4-reductase